MLPRTPPSVSILEATTTGAARAPDRARSSPTRPARIRFTTAPPPARPVPGLPIAFRRTVEGALRGDLTPETGAEIGSPRLGRALGPIPHPAPRPSTGFLVGRAVASSPSRESGSVSRPGIATEERTLATPTRLRGRDRPRDRRFRDGLLRARLSPPRPPRRDQGRSILRAPAPGRSGERRDRPRRRPDGSAQRRGDHGLGYGDRRAVRAPRRARPPVSGPSSTPARPQAPAGRRGSVPASRPQPLRDHGSADEVRQIVAAPERRSRCRGRAAVRPAACRGGCRRAWPPRWRRSSETHLRAPIYRIRPTMTGHRIGTGKQHT